jgi:hypothetical protein
LSALKKDKNYKKQSIGLVIAGAMMLLLLAGMILAPTQASALSKFNTNTDTSNLKHAIRDGVNVNLEHRDQHLNQENLCYRTNTCRESNVGQNTLGNDNSITGFADQSDNIQQSAAPTTANQTTPTPSPTPPTATLTVIKIESGNTSAVPSQFAIHVTGNNPNPPNFGGSATGIEVTLGSGPFNVTETAPTGNFFITTTTGDCAGTIAAGQHLTCTITNTAKTCVDCFTTLLTQAQIRALLLSGSFEGASIEQVCARLSPISESGFISILTGVGVSVTTANELVACLKAAGILFNQVPT